METINLNVRGQRAYSLYISTEMIWKEVAHALRFASRQAAFEAAKRHAIDNGLTWPICTRLPPDTGARSYQLASDGYTWSTIASHLGLARAASACTYARRYAAEAGKPWPLKGGTPARGRLVREAC